MSKVSLKHIYKVYDGKVKAVNDFNLEVDDKEFIVFVGPSGCGKSTTLRMIAGLEEITSGELWIGDRLCNHVEAKNRNISMVFQNYALFPNMTVYDNMAFGLRMHKVAREEIDKRVREAAEILGITEYLARKPKALSGGQRQRVALGRAIVREPSVFLFDEPLSNLDAKLRAKMRTEITRLHKRLQSTFIYVTHDQVEAMTMGDRIVVMKDGYVQQTDTPQNLFRWPANKFVAGFIGTPQMNFFPVTLRRAEDGSVSVRADGFSLTVPAEHAYRIDENYLGGDRDVIMGIRPDDVRPAKDAVGGDAIKAYVALVEELGTQTLIYANTDEGALMTENSPTAFCSAAGEDAGISAGQCVSFRVDTSKLHFFDAHTELTVKHRIPDCLATARASGGRLNLLGASLALPAALADRLGEGEYAVAIPSAALSLSPAGIPGVAEECEELAAGSHLVRVRCGGARVFVLSDSAVAAGENVALSVSADMLSFSADGREVVSAVPCENRLEGRFARVKEGKERNHYVELDGARLASPYEFSRKMYDRGRSIFKKKLAFAFGVNDAVLGEEGVPVSVEEVLDYGSRRYAAVRLGSQKLYVAFEGQLPADPCITINFDRVRVYDSEIDIRLF